ncbi:MAG: hypothetical protein SFY68_06945 [Candidatus Sumerlaeia bacterium]|nr:hypothetical protein [Candidatus Sumerlaeia bacterium]
MLPHQGVADWKADTLVTGYLRLLPMECFQETNVTPHMHSVVDFLYEVHGVVAEIGDGSWVIQTGLPLLVEQPAFPWMFQGQFLGAMGRLEFVPLERGSKDFESKSDWVRRYRLLQVTDHLDFFRHLQTEHNSPIQPGNTTTTRRESFLELRRLFPGKKLDTLILQNASRKLGYFCLVLEVDSAGKTKSFF